MKTLWTIFALTGFISISFFGLLSIHHQGDHMTECLASRLNGSDIPCPEADPLGFAYFHSNALKKISNLIVINGVTALYSMALGLILSFGLWGLAGFNKFFGNEIKFYQLQPLTTYYLLLAIGLHWLSLHENSPSFFRG